MSSIDLEEQKRWYVVHVRSGCEKQAIDSLRDLIELEGLESHFGDIVMPTEEVLEMKNGKKKQVPRKLLPGYILVNMLKSDAAFQVVRHVRNKNIYGFLGSGDYPVPLSQKEVDGIFEPFRATEGKPRPRVLLQPGQVVKIIAGPFAGFNGVIEEADYEKKYRLRVSVIVFQRATSVELEFSEVQAA